MSHATIKSSKCSQTRNPIFGSEIWKDLNEKPENYFYETLHRRRKKEFSEMEMHDDSRKWDKSIYLKLR